MSFLRKAVIGMGNPLKMDDNLGNLLARELKLPKDSFLVIEGGQMPTDFVGVVENFAPDVIYFIDAAIFEGEVGEIRILEEDAAKQLSPGTHALPVTFFSKFFPSSKIFIIGVRPKTVDYGEELSDEMTALFPKILKKVEALILSPVSFV